MENQNNRKEALRKRIEQVLKSRDKGLSDLSGKTIEEVLEEVSIYHQELEFQNLELLRIQEDLEQTEKHYQELFNNAPIGYVLVDSNSIIHSANTMFAQLVNKKPQELKSQSLTSYIHPDYQDQYYLLIKKVLKEKGKSSILVKLNVETKELFTKLECNIFQSQNEVLLRIGFIDVTSEVVNEKQLIDSRERYRAVADYAYHWEYWQDPNGKLLYMSPSCERITGYSKYDFFENPNLIEDIIHPNDRHKFDEHKSIAIIPGKTKFEHTAEYRITRKDGEVRWIGHACLNIFKEDGTHIGLRATNRDITERKRTREELKQKLELLNQTQQIANIGSWELNVETNELIWSNEIYRIFGLKPQQFKGSYDFFLETIHPDDREEVNAAYINSLRDDTSLYEIEHRIIRKDNNEVRYVYEKCYHERDDNGKVIYSIGMVQDITERKLKEQKLVISDRVFNHTVDMLCIAGFDGYFKTLNPSWKKTLGWSAKELMAKPWIEFVHTEDRDATKRIRTVLVDGEEIYQFENRYVCKDGSYKWLSWNSYPYPGENIMFGVARDVTFKKQSEERLRSSELQLKDQNEELTALNEELNQSNEELHGVMEELHESNQRNSALVAANPDVMFVYNRKGVFLDHHTPNPKSLLLKPVDFIGKAANDVLPEFLAKLNQNAIDNLFETKQPQHYSYTLEINGTVHHFDARMVRYGQDKALAIVRDITERKNAEQALRESEQRFQLSMEATNDGLWDWNIKTDEAYYSPAFYTMLGYQTGDFPATGKSWVNLLHPDDKEAALEKNNECIEGATNSFSVEFRLRTKDNEWRWILSRGKCVERDKKGNAIRIVGTHVDITYRKNAENEILKRELLLNKIFDVLPIGLWFADENGKLQRGNPAGIKIWGAEPTVPYEEYGVFKARRLPSGEEIAPTDWALAHTITKGVTITDELIEIDTFDGKKRVILNYTAPVLDNEGNMQGAIVVNNDITELHKAQENLRANEQLLQTISDNMFDLVSLTDLNGNYKFASASHSILGYKIDELIGTNVMDYVHPDDLPKVKSAFVEFLTNQEDNKRVEYRNRCADGSYLWFETVGKFILDKKGNPTKILFNSRDITERKSIEEALAHSHNLMKYIIEHIRGAVAVHDRDLRYIYVSQQYLTDYNIEEKNIIGKHHYEVLPDLPQKWRDAHQLALKGKVISKEDDPFETPDGSIEWSRWECRPWHEADGTIGGIIVYTEIITKRKKAEQALRENEEKYRSLFEANTDGIAIFRINPDDTPTQFIEVNSSATSMLGYSKEEFVTLKMDQIEVNVSHEERMLRITELKKSGIIDFETKLLHKEGYFIYANVKAVTINYLNQPAILNISRDITERKKAEQTLRESEEMMRNSQSVAHICSYSTNLNENEIEKSSWVCSPEFYKIFGIDKTYPHTIEGWTRFIHPDYREEIFAYHESVVKEKKSFNREYKIIRINDGAERWVLGTGELEYDEQGAPVRMHGAIQDITERKKAEQTLRESEERFRMLAELAPVGIIITDKNQNPAYASPVFTNIFGYTIKDIPTVEHWFTLAYPNEKHRTKVKQEWFGYTEAVKKEGSVIPPLEYPVRCMDGSTKQIEFRLAMSGKINVIIFTDITERKKAEQALRESEERFRSLYENATVGIYRTTPSGEIIMANPTLVKMLGYNSFDELKKRNLEEEGYEPHYSREKFQKQIEQNGEVKALESAWKVKGGSTMYISESARLITDSKGKPLYYEGIVEDITESKKAIDALKASEERISSIFRVAPTGIGVIKNRVFVEVNPRLCEMTGYSADELIGQSARMVYPTKEDFEYVGTEKYRQIAEKGTGSVETRWIRKDGTIIEVILSSTPIFKADLSKGVTFTALDITKRKQSERLMQSRVRLLEFAERYSLNELFKEMLAEAENLTQSQIGFYHFINQDKGEITLNQWSEQTQINFCNVTSSFSTHYPIEQAGIWADCVHKRKPQIINSYNDLNRQDKLPKGHAVIERILTVPVIRKKKVVAVLGIGNKNTPYNNNDIDIISQLADLAWEIAERKLAEEEVAKLSKGIEQSPAIVVITDTNGIIEYVNPKFTKVTGYSLKEAIGQNPRILNSGNQSKAFYQNLWDTINSGKDWQGEMLNKKKDGETYWESALISPIKDERGKTKHFIAIKEDITQRKTFEKDLKEKNEEYLALNEELIESNDRIKQVNKALVDARKKAEESDKLKTAFLANMSHEIRTPMNSIIGFSEFLLRPNIAREKQEFFARILNTSCQQLLSVVNDIIDISKIETQQMDIHRELVNINKSINRVKEIFIPQAKQHNVTIKTELYWSDNRAEIITDQTKTDQILTNLVSNAVKFTEDGTVEIGYTLKDRFVEFYVKDTGIGISPKHHQLVFERFQQVEMESTRKYGGTGLGLPICKAFVEMLGGKIWLNSDFGKGTTIYFTLPYIPPQEIDEESNITGNEEDLRLNGKNILIAEDEMANILYLRELIEDTGANVIHAENGKEAVDIALNNPNIDLILMDIKMPVMNGVDATKLIKEHTSKIPIIALTAYAMSGDKDKYLKAGCDGYLSKPVVGVEVISMLNDFLKKPKKK